MNQTPLNDPTPRSGTNNAIRVMGILAIAALLVAILLLALDIVEFEPAGWF